MLHMLKRPSPLRTGSQLNDLSRETFCNVQRSPLPKVCHAVQIQLRFQGLKSQSETYHSTITSLTKICRVGGIRFILTRAGRAERKEGRKEHTANTIWRPPRESPERSGPVSMQYAKVLPSSYPSSDAVPHLFLSLLHGPSFAPSFWSSITSESLGLGI